MWRSCITVNPGPMLKYTNPITARNPANYRLRGFQIRTLLLLSPAGKGLRVSRPQRSHTSHRVAKAMMLPVMVSQQAIGLAKPAYCPRSRKPSHSFRITKLFDRAVRLLLLSCCRVEKTRRYRAASESQTHIGQGIPFPSFYRQQ